MLINNENTRKNLKKKTTCFFTISLILAFVISSIAVLPFAFGQFPPTARESHVYVYASPNPVGIGQDLFVSGWVYPVPSGGASQERSYKNLTFILTKPDGTKMIKVRDTFLAGTAEFTFQPDQVGSWSIVLSFPGDLETFDRTPGVSVPYVFTVTKDPIPYADYTPLPTGYWTWPISQVNREWFRISGAWPFSITGRMGAGLCNYFTTGPETAHILWKMPIVTGGLLGGDQGHDAITRPTSIGQGPSPIVAGQGRLYFTSHMGYGGGKNATTQFDDMPLVNCIDQYSGKLIWQIPLPTVNYTTGENVAAARTGGSRLQLVPAGLVKTVPSAGTVARRPNVNTVGTYNLWISGGGLWNVDPLTGEILWYQLQPALDPTYYDGAWYINDYPAKGLFSCISPAMGRTITHAFPPCELTSTADPPPATSLIWQQNVSQTGIRMNYITEGYIIQLVTDKDDRQRKLNTWDAKTGTLIANGTMGGDWPSDAQNPVYGEGVYSILCEDRKTRAWSFKTGSLLWTSEPMELPYGSFGAYEGAAGLGLIISSSYDGYKYAYNATNGKLVWKQFTGTDNPYNYEYSTNAPPTWGWAISGGGKVYWASGTHTPSLPTQRGDMLYCNDAITGELIFRLPYFKSTRGGIYCGISSGMLWYFNDYDACVYMFGKGETKTTVSVSQNPVTKGASTVIMGRVTDESPIEPGAPAVGDAGMSDWMAYKYTLGVTGPLINLTKVTGVPVHLTAKSSSTGTTTDIGTVVADANGYYSCMWTPQNNDLYTIIANFEGSKSYYSSTSETALGVTQSQSSPLAQPTPTPAESSTIMPTPITTASPTVAPFPPTSGAPTTTYIAIGAAVVIVVAVAAAIVLRRRKQI